MSGRMKEVKATTRQRASRREYDPIAVHAAVVRGQLTLTTAERDEAVRRLLQTMAPLRVAEHLGITRRTVQRSQARLRKAGVRL